MIYGQNAQKVLKLVRGVGAVPEPVIFAYVREAKKILTTLVRQKHMRKIQKHDTVWYFIDALPDNLYYHIVKSWFTVRWLQLGGRFEDNNYISRTNDRYNLTVVGDKAVISSNKYRYYTTLEDLQTQKQQLNTYLHAYPPK